MDSDSAIVAGHQILDGSFLPTWKYWVVHVLVNILISAGAVFWVRRNAQAAEKGRLDAISHGFTESLRQLSESRKVEIQADLRKELLLRLATAIGEALLLVPRIARTNDFSTQEFTKYADRIGLEVNVCRVAASPKTIAATSRFMERFKDSGLPLFNMRFQMDAQDDGKALTRLAMSTAVDLDELLCQAQACIREDLGFGEAEEFLHALKENRERLRAFVSEF